MSKETSRFENTFRIDGKLTGSIVSNGTLVIGEAGQLVGDVEGRAGLCLRPPVEGQHQGQGAESRSKTTGQVQADIDTPSLIIVDGALFEGRCSMTGLLKESSKKGARDLEPCGKSGPLPKRSLSFKPRIPRERSFLPSLVPQL